MIKRDGNRYMNISSKLFFIVKEDIGEPGLFITIVGQK